MKLRRIRVRSLPILALILLGNAASAAAQAHGTKAAGFESRSADAGGVRLAYLSGAP